MDDSDSEQRERGTRWFHRLLPVAGIALALVALAALALPGFRDQLALSTTRQPQPFVELSFARHSEHAMCGRAGDVRFTVVSHLEEQERLTYRVTVAPGGVPRKGAVRLQPEATRQVRTPVVVPDRGNYTLTVRLPDLDQQIRANCSGGRR